MKMIKTLLKPLLAMSAIALLFACNNSSDSKQDDTKKAEDTTAAKTAADTTKAAPAFVPFKVMVIQHTVANFDKWKPAYTAHDSSRKASGLTDIDLLRGVDKPNLVLVVEQIADLQKAKDFVASADLKMAMKKAGVVGKPEITYLDVVRADDAKIDSKERMVVTHRVKDFDAWLKVYDNEGKAVRAGEGVIDRVIARKVDDPNVVEVVFAVTDKAKALAALNSEEKKKLMTSAGVEGKPTVEFWNVAN
jgi:quinol monooxygenase YgiN